MLIYNNHVHTESVHQINYFFFFSKVPIKMKNSQFISKILNNTSEIDFNHKIIISLN